MREVMCPQVCNFLPIPYHLFYRLGQICSISNRYGAYALIWWFLTKYGKTLPFICKLPLTVLIIILCKEVINMRKICYIALAMFNNTLPIVFRACFAVYRNGLFYPTGLNVEKLVKYLY